MTEVSRQDRIAARARRRAERAAARRAAAGVTVAESPAPHAAPPAPPPEASTASPFCDIDNRPLFLDGFARGAACFIVLSGPSVLSLDLSRLQARGIYTVGVNNSPAVFRPNCWTYVDRANKFHDSIWLDPAVLKIMPARHFGKGLRQKRDGRFVPMARLTAAGESVVCQARDMPGVIGHHRNANFTPECWLSEPSINWGNSARSARRNGGHRCLNVMFCVLKIVYALGFRVVYLLGCDFAMSADRPYGFDQSKDSGGVASNNHGYQVMNGMLGQLLPYFSQAGFHVFNCNPASGLTVFPHVAYHAAIKSATGHIEQDPLDTSDWYNLN